MTPEAQRIAIAEACGWQHRLATLDNPVERAGMRLPNTFGPEIEAWWHDGSPKNTGVYSEPPRYLTDLNAMHEAEATFENDEVIWKQYKDWILTITEPHRHEINATAAQRAEAFLLTISKWDDSK